jgi:hypothetical protein
MHNFFDTAKLNMFDITTKVMGYDAVWINSETLREYSAKVHYKHATPSEDLAGVAYFPTAPLMEFRAGDFEGLKALVDAGGIETVNIDGIGVFYIRDANRKYDGDTITCMLAPSDEIELP